MRENNARVANVLTKLDCRDVMCWRGLSLKTQAFVTVFSGDQDKSKSPAAVEMDALKKPSTFSISQCKSIRHTNSWGTSVGLTGINHIQEAKTDTA